ncbi:hypothetical protein EV702DRAFT_1044501 [Suillus placidus]|uniref:Uncharacterized protein n=1 Tax=Suillus placidus TaxID=48579 RepID=A0A9P6ZXK8_9AGAM|nr:hypothetical protein EV702DRAFT_1044501 [Suillus placidus]
MAEAHNTNAFHINSNEPIDEEAEERAGNIREEQGGDVEAQVEAQAWAGEQAMEQAGDMQAETFEATPSMIMSVLLPISALWNYAQEIAQDDMDHAQTHLDVPHPAHPPIPILRRDRCLLVLMLEDRRDAMFRLWQELDEIEHMLGLQHM